jgi:uncharacterized protein (UPF0276 family)
MDAPVGIGLRAPHYAAIAGRRPDLGFLEVHSENYFGGGAPLAGLERLRRDYPVSLHGVGQSLGSADPLDEAHLARLAALAARVEPMLVSEHLSWGSIDGRHANELLPLPFTDEALVHVVARVQQVQERLGCRVLVENVSQYHAYPESRLAEAQFVAEVVRRAGCGLLLDVNNVHVNAMNLGVDAAAYLEAIDPASVGEIHLGGHEESDGLLVDTHGAPVAEAVWSLYAAALARIGPRPTLVERDTRIPPLEALLAEAARAARAIESSRAVRPALAA